MRFRNTVPLIILERKQSRCNGAAITARELPQLSRSLYPIMLSLRRMAAPAMHAVPSNSQLY